MIVPFWKNQEGVIVVLTALLFTVLLALVGLAIDAGNLYLVRTRMQNAVDAAVYAGGIELTTPGVDNPSSRAAAKSFISGNGFEPGKAIIDFNIDNANNPNKSPEINCTMTNNVPTYFMQLFGFETVAITVSAEGVVNQGGPFSYVIFSGNSSATLSLNGSQTIDGSVHANGRLKINGSSDISGSCEGMNSVTVNGSGHIGGSVQADTEQHVNVNGSVTIDGDITGGAGNIGMPDYSKQIADTAAQIYDAGKNLNGSVNVNGNIYVKGDVTLNGSINSTGSILADGDITVNGSSTYVSNSNQLFIYSATGDITINGSSDFMRDTASVIIYAPKGKITLNGSDNFRGRIIGDKVTINGSGNYYGVPVKTLSGTKHVTLIR
jgi:Flp pilus assembly protein TadG